MYSQLHVATGSALALRVLRCCNSRILTIRWNQRRMSPNPPNGSPKCAELVLDVHMRTTSSGQTRLMRTSRDGVAATNAAGVLEDYGDLAEGFLCLYQATARSRSLWAIRRMRLLANWSQLRP